MWSQIVTTSKNDLMKKSISIIPLEIIEQRIFLLRSQKVLLSSHLAELYCVEHRILMQSV